MSLPPVAATDKLLAELVCRNGGGGCDEAPGEILWVTSIVHRVGDGSGRCSLLESFVVDLSLHLAVGCFG
jgi:hypothetical protein